MPRLKQLPLTFALLFSVAPLAHAVEPVGSTLKDFFTASINYSPALKVAEERWHASDARIAFANGQLLPQVNASASASKNRSESPLPPTASDPHPTYLNKYDGRNYSVQLTQVLFNWQAFAARKQAYLQGDQAEAEYYLQLGQLLTVVADNYLEALLAEDTLNLVNTELEATTNQVNQIQQMYNLQLAKITDLYRAKAQQAGVQTERSTAESDVDISRAQLQANSGLEVGGLKRLPTDIAFPRLQGSLEEWLERARTNNKQIEAGTYALKAADTVISQRKSAYMPRLSLYAARQNSDLGYQNTQNQRTDTNSVGIEFNIPLFAGGANRALVREAQSNRNVAENQLQQTSLDVFDRARTAYYKVKSSESRIETGKQFAESAALSYTAMKRGFELGAVTSVDVLNALRDQFKAQRDLQLARYDFLRYSLVLQRDAGTLTAEDLERVSDLLNAPPLRR